MSRRKDLLPWDADLADLDPATRERHEYRIERRATAVHEAGHAIIGFDVGLPCNFIRLRVERKGIFRRRRIVSGVTDCEDGGPTDTPEARVRVALAGAVAEAYWFQENFRVSFRTAYRRALTAHDKMLAKREARLAHLSLGQERRVVQRMVANRWPAVDRVAEALDKTDRLSGEEILRIGGRALSRAARGRGR